MNQNRKDQDVPNRQSNMEQAEGSRGKDESTGERGSGSEQDRSQGRGRSGDESGGISNRPLDEERHRQSRLPERGRSQSEEE
jgi:hypothetical protein